MEALLKTIRIERTAHVYTMGADPKEAKHIWLVLHGYGQLASRIVKKFNHLDLEQIHIMAPEALNKFYFKRNPVILGASWMTKHQRLDEINDYLRYLDQIYESVQLRSSQTFNVLGFSQGSATMVRWLDHARPTVTKMINWAGEFPPDVEYDLLIPYLKKIKEKYYCLGEQDEFIKADRLETLTQFIAKTDPEIILKKFDGGHEINRDLLSLIVQHDDRSAESCSIA